MKYYILTNIYLNQFEFQLNKHIPNTNNQKDNLQIKRLMEKFEYSKVSSFSERPDQMTRYLIQRNMDQLIGYCIREATQFVNTSQTKLKALEQLKYAVLIGQQKTTKHVEHIVKTLVKVWQMDIENSQNVIKQIVEIIGLHVRVDYYLPLIINMFSQQQFKNSPKNTIVMLQLMGHLLINAEGIDQHLEDILRLLGYYQKNFYENDDGLVAIGQIGITLVTRVQAINSNPNFIKVMFEIFLDIQATKSIIASQRQQIHKGLQLLAKKAGYSSVADLHAHEVGPVLQRIIKEKQYVNWAKTSKDRFKFDSIVRNCHSQVSRFLSEILQIIEFMINPQSDLEIRMDTLVLAEYILGLQSLHQALKPHGQRIMKKILIVAIQWKIGKPQIKIRKAGVINMMSLIANDLINQQQLKDSFSELLPCLKNCLSDDWAPQLRLASCQLLEKYLMATKDIIGDDELRELYPILLERLDDSQDPIRKKITVAINVFFTCQYLKLSNSVIQYMVNSLFVHFDDNNEQIQDSIAMTLKFAAKVDPTQVLSAANSNIKRMKHKERCQQLIEYCVEIIEERKL